MLDNSLIDLLLEYARYLEGEITFFHAVHESEQIEAAKKLDVTNVITKRHTLYWEIVLLLNSLFMQLLEKAQL